MIFEGFKTAFSVGLSETFNEANCVFFICRNSYAYLVT